MLRLSGITFFLFFFLTNFAIAQDADTPVKSEIKAVTVFMRGAEVTREATVILEKGTSVLKFEGLSPYLNKNSIQVEGDQKFVILSVNHQINYLNEIDRSEELEEIDDEIEDLLFKFQLRKNLGLVYEEEKIMLIENKSIKGEESSLNIEDFMEMADFYRARLTEVEMKLLEIKRDKNKIMKKLSKLKVQRNELSSETSQPTSEILVNFSSKSETSAKIKLRYIVDRAGWIPVYDVRSDDIDGPIELTYKAKVFQNTGYDWEKIDLKLSTGNPTVSGTKPVVSPWILEMYDPYYEAQLREIERERSEARDKLKNEYETNINLLSQQLDMMSDSLMTLNEESIVGDGWLLDSPDIQWSSTRTEENIDRRNYRWDFGSSADFTSMTESNVSTTFNIKVPYSILSDDKKYDVEVARHDLPVNYNYFSAPKMDNDGFLVAQVSGWDSYNLLPGDANIYYNDTYVGSSFLDTRTTQDTLSISLGRDKGIVIERKKVNEFSKKVTAGSSKKVTLAIEISVRNTKGTAVDLVLEDQIPVSAHKDISVSLDETGGGVLDESSGKLKWKIKVMPCETKVYRFIYTVKYPKNSIIPNF